MVKFLLWCLPLILCSSPLGAQILTPPTSEPARPAASSLAHATGMQHQQQAEILQIPFFDDFARVSGAPDPGRWLAGGGVLVNNRFADSPTTRNAATFDGLRADGQPYGTATAVGPVDSLTSLPIRLEALQPADSVYLSFYWQAGGLGDAPNFSNAGTFFLRLELRRADGQWVQVWQQNGQGRSSPFEQVMLPIRDPAFFHADFAFRFVSSGGRSGGEDLWHLDYVRLDRNRRGSQTQSRDVAIRSGPSSLLRRYTAMPLHQFLRNPAGELAPAVETRLTNRNTVPAAISWRGVVRNLTTGAPADTFLRGNGVVPALESQYLVQGQVQSQVVQGAGPELRLQHTVFLNTSEQDAHYRYNDTASRVTELSDYYAYDDGTAETGFSYNASGAVRVAYRFALNQPDQLEAFRIQFTRTNTPGTNLTFHIWRDEGGLPQEPAIFSQPFRIPEAHQLDHFMEVLLTERVPVEGVFYIGWSQPAGTTFVNVGFDLNERATDQLLGWIATTDWAPLQLERGALLLRPVMAPTTLTAAAEVKPSASVSVHPNPSSGRVHILGAFEAVSVYSGIGRLLAHYDFRTVGPSLDLGHLPSGLYLLRFATRGGEVVRRLVIRQ